VSSVELTERDGEWERDLRALDRAYWALRSPWTWGADRVYLMRENERGYVLAGGTYPPVPTVHVPEGPMRTRFYSDLDQLVEAGWRLDDE
jgi:hypothetical protein